MPAIRYLPLLILAFTFSCTKKQDISNKHGISMIPRTQFTYRGVVERTINLEFDVKKSETTIIKARVQMGRDYNEPLNYQWKIGQNVAVVEGPLKGQIASLKKDEAVEIALKVSGFNSETPRFVRFEILGSNSLHPAFADGIVSSNEEHSFERIVQEVENYKKYEQEK